MSKVKMIKVVGCWECPYSDVNNKCDLECSKSNKAEISTSGIGKNCPLEDYPTREVVIEGWR